MPTNGRGMSLKRFLLGLTLIFLLTGIAAQVQAAETSYKGEVTGLLGNEALGSLKYSLSDALKLDALIERENLRTGLHYQLSDQLGVKAGVAYNLDQKETIGYGGFDYKIPFGANLKIVGFYDRNYQGKDWSRYEAALRIEMYPQQFLLAGVKGDDGKGALIYDFNTDEEPLFFIRGNFAWQWKKLNIKVDPTLYVQGYFFNDYTFTYNVSDRTNLVLNVNNQYNDGIKYRAGIQMKF